MMNKIKEKLTITVIFLSSLSLFGFQAMAQSNSDGNLTYFVNIENNACLPNNLTIPKGSTVKWTNNSQVDHTIIGLGRSPVLNQQLPSNGGSYNYTFNEEGIYKYNCVTPAMQGSINVVSTNSNRNVNSQHNTPAFTSYGSSYIDNSARNNQTSRSNYYQCSSFDKDGFCLNYKEVPSTNLSLPYLSNNSVDNLYYAPPSPAFRPVAKAKAAEEPTSSVFTNCTITCSNQNLTKTMKTTSLKPAAEVQENNQRKVMAYALNIRSSAGMGKNIIGHLKKGDLVTVLEKSKNNNWCKIDSSNYQVKDDLKTAWVSCRYLSK